MTPRAILLALSLLANAALVAAYLVAPRISSRAPHSAIPASTDAGGISGSAVKADPAQAPASRSAKPLPSWAEIDTPDLDELARRLRAAGFTPQEIRMIIGQRIAQLFNPAVTGEADKPQPYWRPAWRSDSWSDPERRKQMAEQQRLYRKHLNPYDGIVDDPDQLAAARRRWGDLPVDKLQAIAKIESDYEELNMQQYAEGRVRPGETSAADTRRLIEQERLADIAKVLTPEEFAAWEIRASPTANRLRFQLEAFKPTEDEYKAIFAINQAYEARLFDPQLSPDARKALANEVTAKVSEVLGPDRALDYDAAINQNSRDQTAGLVSRLGLPARVAVEVRQTQQDFTQRGKDIRANSSLSPADRDAQLAALARQAETQLTAKLGANGFEAYNDLKGEWIRALQPKPAH